jgi:hypothetical protein
MSVYSESSNASSVQPFITATRQAKVKKIEEIEKIVEDPEETPIKYDLSFLDDEKQKPLDNNADTEQLLDRLDCYKEEMENMMAFLNEVTNENKLKQDITAI